MEFQEGAVVYSADQQEVGKLNRLVLNPVTAEITHVVVEKGFLFPEDRVVPVDWITSADAERVTLNASADQMQELPPFEETHYVSLDENESRRVANVTYGYPPYYYWYPPFGTPTYTYSPYPAPQVIPQTGRNIPEDTVSLREGTDVLDADGDHIGDVERVLADPESNRATHFLISKGLLLKEMKMVPAAWISRIAEDKVYLAVGGSFVDRLPDYRE